MKWASVISEEADFEASMEECCRELSKQLRKQVPDIVFLFISPHFRLNFLDVPAFVSSRLKAKAILGCSADGIIGSGHEVEQKPAISMTAGVLPGVEVKTFHLINEDLPDLDASPHRWEKAVGVQASTNPQFVLLAEPFSFQPDTLAMGLDFAFPKSTKVGGLASGSRAPGGNVLYAGSEGHTQGVVGAAFSGRVAIDAVVAQGCRPIGGALPVTQAEDNILMGLDGKPPLQVLSEIFATAGQRDRELLRNSLFLGFLMDPLTMEGERGEFLIRNIVGMDPARGYLAVGSEVRVGQTVQFHLRDAETSSEDLERALSRYVQKNGTPPVESALLFSCLGRGIQLYGKADHDSQIFLHHAGSVPVGGFFCNGEIGPVGGITYLHGYTSCFGIFKDVPDLP